jgi:hypothetical protein
MNRIPLLAVSAALSTAALAIYAYDTVTVVAPILSAARTAAGVHTDYIFVLTAAEAVWMIWTPLTLLGLGVAIQWFLTFGANEAQESFR